MGQFPPLATDGCSRCGSGTLHATAPPPPPIPATPSAGVKTEALQTCFTFCCQSAFGPDQTSDSMEIIFSLVLLLLTVSQRKCNRLVSPASVSQRLATDPTDEGTKTVSQRLAIDQTGEGTKTVSQFWRQQTRLARERKLSVSVWQQTRLAREQKLSVSVWQQTRLAMETKTVSQRLPIDQTGGGTKIVSH